MRLRGMLRGNGCGMNFVEQIQSALEIILMHSELDCMLSVTSEVAYMM